RSDTGRVFARPRARTTMYAKVPGSVRLRVRVKKCRKASPDCVSTACVEALEKDSSAQRVFTVVFYGPKIFRRKTAQIYVTLRQYRMAELPSVRDAVQRPKKCAKTPS